MFRPKQKIDASACRGDPLRAARKGPSAGGAKGVREKNANPNFFACKSLKSPDSAKRRFGDIWRTATFRGEIRTRRVAATTRTCPAGRAPPYPTLSLAIGGWKAR